MNVTVPAIATFLASARPYGNLSPDERMRIACAMHMRNYKAGERVQLRAQLHCAEATQESLTFNR